MEKLTWETLLVIICIPSCVDRTHLLKWQHGTPVQCFTPEIVKGDVNRLISRGKKRGKLRRKIILLLSQTKDHRHSFLYNGQLEVKLTNDGSLTFFSHFNCCLSMGTSRGMQGWRMQFMAVSSDWWDGWTVLLLHSSSLNWSHLFPSAIECGAPWLCCCLIHIWKKGHLHVAPVAFGK